MSSDLNDDRDLLLAVADDFLAAYPPDDTAPMDVEDVYDWLIGQAQKLSGEL